MATALAEGYVWTQDNETVTIEFEILQTLPDSACNIHWTDKTLTVHLSGEDVPRISGNLQFQILPEESWKERETFRGYDKYFVVLKKALQYQWHFVIKSADDIDAQSHFELAKHFERKKDFRSALEEIKKADAKGLTQAHFHLGKLYHAGPKSNFKLNKNMQKAIHYYEKASAKHRGEAMCAIGMIYQNGDGVDRSHVTAADWHKKCASAEQQKRDKALSRDRNAPSQWALTSMFNLGLIYHEGKWNMAQDDAEAVRWWLKGKEHDFPAAIFNLGIMYLHGYGVAKDERQAQVLFKRASRLNPRIKAPTVDAKGNPPKGPTGSPHAQKPASANVLFSPKGQKPAADTDSSEDAGVTGNDAIVPANINMAWDLQAELTRLTKTTEWMQPFFAAAVAVFGGIYFFLRRR